MKFPTKDGRMAVNALAPGVDDQYQNGVRLDAVKVALFMSNSATGNVFSNGLPLDAAGAVVTVDCPAVLPAGVQWCNGIPVASGAVCVSSVDPAYWSNGIAFTSCGAVSVTNA